MSERTRVARRTSDPWARRIKSLEREFERADRARNQPPPRSSWPVAILVGAVVILVAVLVVRSGQGGTTPPPAPPAPADAFAGSPADSWRDATAALVLPEPAPAGGTAAAGVTFPAGEVQTALTRVRAYLLTARTGDAVLVRHDLTALYRLAGTARPPGPVDPRPWGATLLAGGNSLAAPPRLDGALSYALRPARPGAPARVVVTANLVWAYALQAAYPVAALPDHVVAIHERAELAVDAGSLRVSVLSDKVLWHDVDCGYRTSGLLGLPRADDPAAYPGENNGVSQYEAFALDSVVEASAHQCRPQH